MGKIYKEINKDVTTKAVGNYVEPVCGIIHRDEEIDNISTIMNRSRFRSVLLVGDAGIGKRSIVEGYAKKLLDNGFNTRIMNLDFDMLLDGVSQATEYRQTINSIFDMVENGDKYDYILHINNFGHLLNKDCYANSGFAFVNNLISEIENKGLRIIASTTNDGYNEIENSFKNVIDMFTVVKVTELTKAQCVDILNNEISDFVEYHHIALPGDIAETICDNADKYVKDHPFPFKAELLLDNVCSYIDLNKVNVCEIEDIEKRISNLKLDLNGTFKANDFEKCEEIQNNIKALEEKKEKLDNKKIKYKATCEDVLEAIGHIVGVSMTKLSKDKSEFLKEMPAELKKNVIGQDETIDKIVKNIRRNQLGLRKSSHSAGNYMFIGSTGVGKTHLAKQLAKYLYGSEENLLRFDMSEYQAEIDVSKLLGSAPGYVGYKESGLLVKGLAKNPETVILFDEIEKAHPKIYDVLLQLLDEGKVTGSDGKKVDGSKSLIIFTSNVGVKSAKELASPIGFTNNSVEEKAAKEESIMKKALNKRFSPEFLNRLDSICYFNPLDHNTLTSILDKELSEMNVNIKQITGKEVVLTPAVNSWMIDRVEKENNGARPIIRLLQQEIEEQVADLVVEDAECLKTRKKTITADIIDDKVVLK